MPQLMSEELNVEFSNMVGKFFTLNRICDRGVSVLSVTFAMNKSSEVIHKKICHLAPSLADLISEFQDSRNCLTVYPATPIGDKMYGNPLEFFKDILNMMIEIEGDMDNVRGMAKELNDYASIVFLDSFMSKILSLTKQCLLLVDKSEFYGDDLMSFDHRIEDWIII
jgi:hypothetical protein